MLICEPLLKDLTTKFNTGPASCYAEMVRRRAPLGIPVVCKACGNKHVPPVRLSQFDRFSQLLNVTATRSCGHACILEHRFFRRPPDGFAPSRAWLRYIRPLRTASDSAFQAAPMKMMMTESCIQISKPMTAARPP